jgi:uncharacterized protein (DUF488 family)
MTSPLARKPPELFTIGYEKLLPPELFAELEAAGVKRLIDVRYRAQSRRPGMSKTRLSEALAERGIAYEHRAELGTPPDIRWFFKNRRTDEGRAAFRAHIEDDPAIAALAAELPNGPPTALLCLEAEPAHCHRRVLAKLMVERVPGLVVTDL